VQQVAVEKTQRVTRFERGDRVRFFHRLSAARARAAQATNAAIDSEMQTAGSFSFVNGDAVEIRGEVRWRAFHVISSVRRINHR